MTPRVAPEERRSQIVEAAIRCFARTGYHGTSMDDIVAESGLSKGTLYWHFKNKQALFLAMVEASFEGMAQTFEQTVSGGGSASERLRNVVALTTEMVVNEKQLADLFMDFWAESRRDEALNQYFRDLYRPYIEMLVELIEQGVESGEFRQVATETVAPVIAAIFDGLLVQAMIGLPVEDYLHADGLVDWMLKGLLPHRGSHVA